jgi:hypothetical protein
MRLEIYARSVSGIRSQVKRECICDGFHQGWCNSSVNVNRTLQKLEIVLVSDPFTKDSEGSAVPVSFNKVDASSGGPARPSLGRFES